MKVELYAVGWEPTFQKLRFEILNRTGDGGHVYIKASDANALWRFETWLEPYTDARCPLIAYCESETYAALFRIFRDRKRRRNTKKVKAYLTEIHFLAECYLSERYELNE